MCEYESRLDSAAQGSVEETVDLGTCQPEKHVSQGAAVTIGIADVVPTLDAFRPTGYRSRRKATCLELFEHTLNVYWLKNSEVLIAVPSEPVKFQAKLLAFARVAYQLAEKFGACLHVFSNA